VVEQKLSIFIYHKRLIALPDMSVTILTAGMVAVFFWVSNIPLVIISRQIM